MDFMITPELQRTLGAGVIFAATKDKTDFAASGSRQIFDSFWKNAIANAAEHFAGQNRQSHADGARQISLHRKPSLS